ncbi:MAG: methyltransferase domain-containing protein [Nitrospirae bacterium]|nr:methyltransferase domain-containing protein [Nitrospirota bacterium]
MKWDAEKYDLTHAPQIDAGRELIEMAGVRAGDSILDIGCGTGTLTAELARLAHKGKVTGIDPSIEMLDGAKNKCSSFPNISLFNIPAQALEFQKEFDLVFSNSTFQWIKEQEDVMVRAYRALKPDGRITVQMPAKDFCWTLTENIHSAIVALGLEKKFNKMVSPWHFPLKEEMNRFLKDAGFRNINVFYKDYMLLFESVNEVVTWGVSAALRPFLAPLSEKKQERFKYAFAMGFENYRTDKGIEFNFRRLFAFAEK